MYTTAEYEKDLGILKGLEGLLQKKPQKEWKTIEFNNKIENNYIRIESDEISGQFTSLVSSGRRPYEVKKISGKNFPLLRRSEFDLIKFKTNLKLDKSLDEEDDYFAPFISLWTQLENEYKIRLYKPFIPENVDILLDVMDRSHQLKGNCLEYVVRNNKPVTFGLINEVLQVIETGFKMGERGINDILESIFENSRYDIFFKKYSLYRCLNEFNIGIRNTGLHENKFIPEQLYANACKKLFMKPRIDHWCNSDEPCLFTDYLKLLPETMKEVEISGLEKRIARLKETGLKSEKEQIDALEQELEFLKRSICQI